MIDHRTRNARARVLRVSFLAASLAVAAGFAGQAMAQATTGTIAGQATAGSKITVQSLDTGFSRTVTADGNGHYSANSLPIGNYTVSVDGAAGQRRDNVAVRIGQSTDVSFVNATSLEGVTIQATALPSIDVSLLDTRTVLGKEELQKIPMARSVTAAALLAPGVVGGDSRYGNVASFGGGSVSENAYYVNGYNVTNPLTNIGFMELPYGSIDQLEILTGGYSAAYGHSTGGVINMVGRRGSNEWHFGGQVLWSPKFARSGEPNAYYKHGPNAGKLYNKGSSDKEWGYVTSAYIGGPLIKDKLFLFASAEFERKNETQTLSAESTTGITSDHRAYKDPRWYTKLDWNINDNNILELSAVGNKEQRNAYSRYDYDYSERTRGDFFDYGAPYKNSTELYTGKFTSYITDDLTFTAQWGQTKVTRYQGVSPLFDENISGTTGTNNQNPDITGGTPILSPQSRTALYSPDRRDSSRGLRAELQYKIGDHTLLGGVDNQTFNTYDQGTTYQTGGYWSYAHTNSPTTPISSGLGVDAPANYPNGQTGYYVVRGRSVTLSNAQTDQQAYYLEDRWQITDRFLLSLGLRHEGFKNYNSDKVAYVKQLGENAPRIGFSWDVFGDSSLKVFGNAGRYYLAMPSNVAIRAANGSYNTSEYFTYSGIDANGAPTGLIQIAPGEVSPNNEFGQAKDPRTVATKGLKPEYQDEYILGLEKALTPQWNVGAKLTFRKLRSAIDDMCPGGAYQPFADYFTAQGIPYEDSQVQGCFLFNPGEANTFRIDPTGNGQFETFTLTNAQLGFPRLKRRYYALDTFLEHPFDGKWYGKVEYTFSRSYGNAEGQTKSDIGQADVSVTQDWDSSYLMVGTNGPLPNDRTHQIKAYGYYQITPEWLVGASLRMQSGRPKNCLGFYGNGDGTTFDAAYGSSYEFCNGVLQPRGSKGRYPWTNQLDLNVSYRPAFADHKLAFNVDIFNVFNSRKVLSSYEEAEDSERGRDENGQLEPITYDPSYGTPISYQTPRYVRFGVTYDF